MWRPMRPGRVSAGSSALERHVAGADEVDLLLARLRRLQAQRRLPMRCGTMYIASRNVLNRRVTNSLHERRLVDAVHHDEQLVEREPAALAAHARDHVADRAGELGHDRAGRRPRRLGAQREQLARATPRSRARGRRLGVARRRGRRTRGRGSCARLERLEAAAERLAAHADGVDLVDEDDALAAPLVRQLLRLAGQEADDHRVHADEGLREAGARDRHERAVERRGDAPWRASSCRCRARRGRARRARACRPPSRTPRRTARARRRG